MLEKLESMHNQDDCDDDDDVDCLYKIFDDEDDFKLMAQKEHRKEIGQFIDNLCNFTPLLYQFTAPRYPVQPLGHYPCSRHYSRWHCNVFNINNSSKLHELSSENKPNCDRIISAEAVYDHCKYNTGCNFHQSVYQYMKLLYARENDCIKIVPRDWKKSMIDFHYGDDNKKGGNKKTSNVPKQIQGRRKKSKVFR